jgi:hypothetical protein
MAHAAGTRLRDGEESRPTTENIVDDDDTGGRALRRQVVRLCRIDLSNSHVTFRPRA